MDIRLYGEDIFLICVVQCPHPGVLELAAALTRVLSSHEGKVSLRALFAVIKVAALVDAVDIQVELLILCHQNDLVRSPIVLVDGIRILDLRERILKTSILINSDLPGGQPG